MPIWNGQDLTPIRKRQTVKCYGTVYAVPFLCSQKGCANFYFHGGTALKSKTPPPAPTNTTTHQQGGEAAICCRKCAAASAAATDCRPSAASPPSRRLTKTSANLRFSQGRGADFLSLLEKTSCLAPHSRKNS